MHPPHIIKPVFYWQRIDTYWPMFYSDLLWPEKGKGSLVLPLVPNRGMEVKHKFSYSRFGFEFDEIKSVFTRNVLDYGLKLRKNYGNVKRITIMGDDPLFNRNLFFFKTWFEYLKKWGYHWEFCIYTIYKPEEIPDYIWDNVEYIVWNPAPQVWAYTQQTVCKNDYFIQLSSRESRIYNKNRELVSDCGRYYFDKEPYLGG